MPYLNFRWTKLDSEDSQFKGLDVNSQMHTIAKIFDIVKFLENEKNQKIEKIRERIGKMAQKIKKAYISFSGEQSLIQIGNIKHCKN